MESIRMGITEEKISRDQGMPSYRCKVLAVEDKMRSWRPGGEILLKSFYVDGVRLKLQLYPNGNTIKEKYHTSIYVENLSPYDIKIDYELSMGYAPRTRYIMRIFACIRTQFIQYPANATHT